MNIKHTISKSVLVIATAYSAPLMAVQPSNAVLAIEFNENDISSSKLARVDGNSTNSSTSLSQAEFKEIQLSNTNNALEFTTVDSVEKMSTISVKPGTKFSWCLKIKTSLPLSEPIDLVKSADNIICWRINKDGRMVINFGSKHSFISKDIALISNKWGELRIDIDMSQQNLFDLIVMNVDGTSLPFKVNATN